MWTQSLTLVLAALACKATSFSLDATSSPSIKTGSADFARSLASMCPAGLLPAPAYWWESANSLSALVSYQHNTGDASYEHIVLAGILSQATSANDFMMQGVGVANDDQAWWGRLAMSAAEYKISDPPAGQPKWVDFATNVYNEQKGRWDTTRCKGGMKWKINPNENGYDYKSTIATAGYFELAARLALYNKDQAASEIADAAYDWLVSVGLIDVQTFAVFDGTDDSKGSGCIDVNHNEWSYNIATVMYGSAVMASQTGDHKWVDRVNGFLGHIKDTFTLNGNLYEPFCEKGNNCDLDQQSFKAVLASLLAKTAAILPETADTVASILTPAANTMAGDFSDSVGFGDKMTTLESVSGLLVLPKGKKRAIRFFA
ncbi:glycoside hydrolase [Mytilinidion resinicola]|uniref:mannan endo-1,6-alpha-mannosidase n=1 Tax=Mytilinidion resinicola TaxID=574789 RepID=A0A6A6Z9Q8_9PEZI|nr:glycoside hydrolase [Mytilinidion resinicola]KAF2817014.1 glycoside hydrolase [Mytilinidion resinicola]